MPLKINRETNYSKDKNLWHLSHEGLDLEDPANEPDYAKPGFLELGVAPEQAPDTPAYITIHFEKGKPTALDGKAMKVSTLLKELNAVGGANGIGIIDIVENRLVGMKSRGVYETPGGTILYFAHEQLEMLCLDKEIPHGTAVEITKFSERDSGVIDVDATIYCEKASHKGIIIGKQGAMLKKISSLARQDMEKFMGTKVYLETWVKVKENWRDNVNYVRSFGYRDE